VVTKILVNCLLLLLALLLAYFDIRRWQKSKRIWYIISAAAAVLSGIAFWVNRPYGFLLLVGAGLLFALGELFKKSNKFQG